MQNMLQPAQFNSKDTVTEAEIVLCPAAMVGAATFDHGGKRHIVLTQKSRLAAGNLLNVKKMFFGLAEC